MEDNRDNESGGILSVLEYMDKQLWSVLFYRQIPWCQFKTLHAL